MWKAPEVLQLAKTGKSVEADVWLKCVSCPHHPQGGEVTAQGKNKKQQKKTEQNKLNNFLSDKKILNRINNSKKIRANDYHSSHICWPINNFDIPI